MGSKEGLRLILGIIASKGWVMNSIDIKSAFLQGKELDRSIFVVPPKEAQLNNEVWQLKKAVYIWFT